MMIKESQYIKDICIIIPTYNNAGTIADIVQRCMMTGYAVIVVNDGSTDNRDFAKTLNYDGVEIVTLERNRGKGAAIKAGFIKAAEMGFKYVITIDADGQHYPEDIPLIIEAHKKNPDAIIVGERQDLESQQRSGGSKFANSFSNFWFCVQTLRRLRDTQSGYRLYPLYRLYGLRFLTSRYEAELELLVFAAWHGVEIVSQPVRVYYPPEKERVSHFRPAYDFTRISILNTCLCFLALLYALPMAVVRWILTGIRTVYSLLFFVVVSLFGLLPISLYYVITEHNSDNRTWKVHKLLHYIGKLVMEWHGIPGVKYSVNNPENEDFSKPAMVICNHQSSLDIMAMLAQSPKLAILTKDWVYHNPFFGYAVRNGEYYPLTKGVNELMPRLRSLVERGYSIVIYPEGTRSPDCRIQRFHKGAFEIADTLGLDILPIVENGAGRVLPKGGKYLRKGEIRIDIDKRIAPTEYRKHGEIRKIASWFRKYYVERVCRLLLCLLTISFCSMSAYAQEKVRLWEGTEVYAKSVTLEIYPEKSSKKAPCIIVCPGGSYSWHDREAEGVKVCQWLQNNGITACLLNYRVQGIFQFVTHSRLIVPGRQYPKMLQDIQMAIHYLRQNADRLCIDKNKVGAMGFSAGGHLVMLAAEMYDTDFLTRKGIKVVESLRPDFVASIYPVVTLRGEYAHKRSRRALLGEYRKYSDIMRDSLSLELHVKKDCPPVFLMNCKDDPVVKYQNSELLDSALTANGVPHKYIQYQTGGHGFGASSVKGTVESREWTNKFIEWLWQTLH